MNLNKGISTPIAILLIVVVAAVAGIAVWQFTTSGEEPGPTPKQPGNYTTQADCEEVGFYWYEENCHEEKQSEPTTKQPGDYTTQAACEDAGYYWYEDACHEKQQSKTADWKTYTDKKYEFKVKYPPQVELDSRRGLNTDYRFVTGCCQEPKGIDWEDKECLSPQGNTYLSFFIKVKDNPDDLSLRNWVKEKEACGGLSSEESLASYSPEEITVGGRKALWLKDVGGCPPGGSAMLDGVWINKGRRMYVIQARYESSPPDEVCTKEIRSTIERILSTFEFTD
ncbi:MAG: hypothetical protein V5A57_03555 [Candidatus Paceibacterota bacterium]